MTSDTAATAKSLEEVQIPGSVRTGDFCMEALGFHVR